MPIIQEPDELYHARTWEVSNSYLAELQRSPYHFWAAHLSGWDRPRSETNSMSIGSVVHALALQPDRATELFIVQPQAGRNTTAGSGAWAEIVQEHAAALEYLDAKTIMKMPADDWQDAIKEIERSSGRKVVTTAAYQGGVMAFQGMMRTPKVRRWIELRGQNELTVTWRDPVTDIPCKGRIDKLIRSHETLVDIKTTKDASPWKFGGSIATYRYHIQAAFYPFGLANCGDPEFAGAADWPLVWIVVENVWPYATALYTADDDDIQRGREIFRRLLDQLRRCLDRDHWPSYNEDIEIIKMARWGHFDNENTEGLGDE